MAIDAKSRNIAEIASGAPMAVDVKFGLGRTLYVLAPGAFGGGDPGAPAIPHTGLLSRVNADGTLTVLATALNLPTSMEGSFRASHHLPFGVNAVSGMDPSTPPGGGSPSSTTFNTSAPP